MDGDCDVFGNRVAKKPLFGCSCLLLVIIVLVVCLSLSFGALDQLDYGIDYNTLSLTVDGTHDTAGLYFLGLGHVFVTYPKVVQTIALGGSRGSEAEEIDGWQPLDKLSTRTRDGLPITLSVSFQYRYIFEYIEQLFLTYNQEQREVYEYTASAVIANVATNFSAYTFFNNKAGIANVMQAELSRIFELQLFARVESLQITQVELPAVFQNAILDSIATKQNITTSQRYLENMLVTFESQRLVADREKNQTVIIAAGLANKRNEEAYANAEITTQTVAAEMNAYKNLVDTVELDSGQGLSYFFWDTQTLDTKNTKAQPKDFVVGMNPNTYIAGSK